jgi:hypothetical protein
MMGQNRGSYSNRLTSAWVIGLAAFLSLDSATLAAEFPPVKVTNIRRIAHNGEHNAFTDLAWFQGHIYLTFRTCPDGHMVHPTSRIIVMRSSNGKQWEKVHTFGVTKRDTRDPHLQVFQDKLFVYTGTWYCGDSSPKKWDMNQHLGYAVSSADGKKWSKPQMLEGTYGHYIWRTASHGGKVYMCGRRKTGFAEVASRAERDVIVRSMILVSSDGLKFSPIGSFQDTYGDETAILFEPDGQMLAISRRGGGRTAQVVRLAPPYSKSVRVDLDRYIGGPLLKKWEGRYVVGGRNLQKGSAYLSLCWLKGDKLTEFAALPSGGDCSYPGLIKLCPGCALVSYYSSHEKDAQGRTITAIYLAELEL